MTMESSDEQALDLLSSPKAIDVRLQRRMNYGPKAWLIALNAQNVGWDTLDYLSTGLWWPALYDRRPNFRTLNGELQLDGKDLMPSTESLDFTVKVRSLFSEKRYGVVPSQFPNPIVLYRSLPISGDVLPPQPQWG